MSYEAQSKSMSRVIKSGAELEKLVKHILNAKGGNIKYDKNSSDTLQTDIVIPNTKNPKVIYSITHTDPDKPGHSNENKFQLKLGEIVFLKTHDPSIKCILVVGGTKDAWLQYVLEAFPYFFDEVIYLWGGDFKKRILNANNDQLKNCDFWNDEKKRRDSIVKNKNLDLVPFSQLRLGFYEKIIKKFLGVNSPEEIDHPILKQMASSAHQAFKESIGERGIFWNHLSEKRFDAIWQERNYYNPNEAVVENILSKHGFFFLGRTGKDVEISNLLHQFGLTRTRVGEDFVLFSKKHKKAVYIQCKASGGGKTHHGKNIMNRAKEQNGRSILYRCCLKNKKLISKPKNFFWIGILDGNWKLPQKSPLKYYNMLEIAGYDKLIGADSLVDSSFIPLEENELEKYLTNLDCYKEENIPKKVVEDLLKQFKMVPEIK
uniref:Uncharacterized protein n=1 Tax=uncultured marine crenarchaeote HF4000_APKG6D9 TaxID=455597 RepID=B3T947_9ARCH|nr:hypothetical protein ALOHA_HF4000APKG6D9ctg2g11 [uncultured marine crenarchaeote HF4000_APKG6D9]